MSSFIADLTWPLWLGALPPIAVAVYYWRQDRKRCRMAEEWLYRALHHPDRENCTLLPSEDDEARRLLKQARR